jgi:hypothetical protein
MRGIPGVGGSNSFVQHERKERSKFWNRRASHAGIVALKLSIVSKVKPWGTVTTSVNLTMGAGELVCLVMPYIPSPDLAFRGTLYSFKEVACLSQWSACT